MKVARSYNDAELLKALQDKDSLNEAIQFMYRGYLETISSFITNNSGSRQDAEDMFQEVVVTFIDLVQKEKFRGDSSIKTFLVAITRNLWLNELKKRERSGYREKAFEHARDEEELDVSHLIGDREIRQQFRELLNKLGESCKKILLLFYYENLSMKEMLQHLPYENEQVVRNKKYKCLQQLTNMLKENPAIATQINTGMK